MTLADHARNGSDMRTSHQLAQQGGDPLMESSRLRARAYRDGRVVCGRVAVTLVRDVRLATEAALDQRVRVQFLERVSEGLRCELERLVQARGVHGRRLADTLAPIEIVWHESRGRCSVLGRLEAPTTQRHGSLEEIGFPLRLQRPRA